MGDDNSNEEHNGFDIFHFARMFDMDIPVRWEVFHKVCFEGNLSLVEFMIEHVAADVNSRDHYGKTPLYRACEEGHLEIALLLIENGAQVDAKQMDGTTPLSSACYHRHLEIVKLLIETGADVNAEDIDGDTPFDLACSRIGHVEIAKLLFENGANVNAGNNYVLARTCRWGHLEIINFLLGIGAGLNTIDIDGMTPLYSACLGGNLEAVQLLLNRGADVRMEARGLTPLQVAAERNHREVVWCLLHQYPWLVSERLD